ncbi:hypothetical protein TYRP_003961 [Tyrophagus putrescentiae]|nr:hypothetical protein TYRP_003961 [Tyrophagus putrescentiae]
MEPSSLARAIEVGGAAAAVEAEVFTPQLDLTTIDFTPAPAGLGAVLVFGFGGFKVEGAAACPKLLLGFELTSFTAELFFTARLNIGAQLAGGHRLDHRSGLNLSWL